MNSSQDPVKKIAANVKNALKEALYCRFVFFAKLPVTSSAASLAIVSGVGSSELAPAMAADCAPVTTEVMPAIVKACHIMYFVHLEGALHVDLC